MLKVSLSLPHHLVPQVLPLLFLYYMMAHYLHIIINQEAKHKITIKTIVEITKLDGNAVEHWRGSQVNYNIRWLHYLALISSSLRDFFLQPRMLSVPDHHPEWNFSFFCRFVLLHFLFWMPREIRVGWCEVGIGIRTAVRTGQSWGEGTVLSTVWHWDCS